MVLLVYLLNRHPLQELYSNHTNYTRSWDKKANN